MSLNSVLNTSKDSLLTYQLAIGLTGSNIANVNTPGYSRQSPILQTVGSADVAATRAQFSVNVSGIARTYDKYLENQIVDQAKTVGYGEAKSDVLDRIEGIFQESSGGPSDLLNKFWNAWEEASANPGQQAARNALLSVAGNLTATIRRIDSELTQVVTDAGSRIDDVVSQINITLSKIADLNSKITSYAEDRGDANTLKDSRTELLMNLSDMLDISYTEDDKGNVNVFLPGGQSLILGSKSWQLAVETQGGTVSDIVYADNSDKSLKNAIVSGEKGRLAALVEVGDTLVPGYRDKLDSFVAKLVSEVNALHRQGYDASGNVGGDFFDPPAAPATEVDAGSFRVSAAIVSDFNKIAAASTVNGDGENALLIGQIREKSVMSGGTSTLNDYYGSLVGEIGQDVADAKNNVDYRTSVMTQLTNRRESVSGVSLDEEMMNLIKYQMSYNTSGKLVSTVNEMLATLMQLVN
ncbi:MAG: flagellar hook-associated protein FlgK [Syntrophales bacterium]|jgi:flagellar hook-associated protein 1 FlgK|nr:flagellar hook-associated protein FlgK [Syntrophales bacterium]